MFFIYEYFFPAIFSSKKKTVKKTGSFKNNYTKTGETRELWKSRAEFNFNLEKQIERQLEILNNIV
jgi:hypothetical protein